MSEVDDDLQRQAEALAEAKEGENLWIEHRKRLGGRMLDTMLEVGRKTVKINRAKDSVTIRAKKREDIKVNPEKLKKRVGATAYNKLTSPRLDEVKLEAAIRSGEIDANDVAACTEETVTDYIEVRFGKKDKG